MAETRYCPDCQAVLPPDAPEGFCPVCEFRGALDLAGAEAGEANDLATATDGSPSVDGQLSALARIRFFGDYELLEEIARGGMGVVFKARQISLNRPVALKMILNGPLASRAFVERFQTEAEAAARLDHPNIVPIYEVGEEAGQHYYSMKLVEGVSLAEGVAGGKYACRAAEKDGPRALRAVATLVAKVAHAVHYAHQRGILHRDLKPGNILLDLEGEPFVTDFGLAKIMEKDSGLTLSHAMLGTASYMAPEQAAAGAKELTTAADVYSLGAMLYELLAGETPFHANTPLETMRQAVEDSPQRPSSVNPLVDRDLETICLKCLEKNPSHRYGSAQALAEDLQRWLHSEPILARPTSTVTRLRKWARRKPALAGLVVALGIVFVLGGAGVLWQWQRAERSAAAEREQGLVSERNLYVSEIQVASRELEDHNLVGARERLERIAQSPSQRELRGWEWRYLMGQCRSEELRALGRHDSPVWDLAVSPDDQWVATISEDGVAKLWDISGRREVRTWQAHVKLTKRQLGIVPSCSIAFSSDGQHLATGGADGDVCLWNVLSLDRTTLPDRLDGFCTGIAFSNDGRLLAALSFYGTVNLWTMSDGAPHFSGSWDTHLKHVAQGLAFSPDGGSLAVAAYQKTASLWSTSAPDFRRLRDFPGSAAPLVISPDGRSLVAAVLGQHGLQKWSLEILQEEQEEEEKSWRGREAGVTRLACSLDGRLLAAGFGDGTIMLWDVVGDGEPRTLMGHEGAVTGLAFLRNKPLLVSASADHTVRLWDASMPGHLQPSMRHGFAVMEVGFSPDSRYLASVARESTGESPAEQHTVKLWEVSTGAEIAHAAVGGSDLSADVAFSPDGRFVAPDSWSDILRIFTVPDLREVTTLAGHCGHFPPDGRTVIYASGNRIVRASWPDVLRGSPDASVVRESPDPSAVRGSPDPAQGPIGESTIGQLTGKISRLALSSDGGTVAATSIKDDGVTIHLWDPRASRYLGPLPGHVQRIYRLAFSPDGSTLASAGWDGKLGLWDVTDRRKLEILRGHYSLVDGVAFSPDGQTIATSGDDAVRLWNLASRQQVAVLRTDAIPDDVAFSPDGRWLAAAMADGTIRLWHAPSFEELEAADWRPTDAP